MAKMAVLGKRGKSKDKDLDLQSLFEWVKKLLFDPSRTWIVGIGLLFAEIVVNFVVIWKIKCEWPVLPFLLTSFNCSYSFRFISFFFLQKILRRPSQCVGFDVTSIE